MSKEPKNLEQRDGFQSKWGFILACIGSAVGMGNIWRFPIMVQQYGGMTFLLPYFLFVILIGASGVIEEFALGRRAKAGPVGAFGMCTKERTGSDKAGKALGAIPIIGALMDRTNGKFGKFRPFMAIGNIIMAVSILILYGITPMIPDTMMWARYAAFVGLYFVWVIGYTFQTSCTRSGQTVLTNDPKQRPLFTIFNTIGSLLGMGIMQFLAPILAKSYEAATPPQGSSARWPRSASLCPLC